ncbi:DUF1127 domain-containing protein [Pseudophaeobacter sp. C1-32P7]|uniref:DUF1127 domain-containing protein n=1 Tax=Pseudophaeobacter sp. C1-32P7 TaxID=3098142 RepID=UPI0034D46C9D
MAYTTSATQTYSFGARIRAAVANFRTTLARWSEYRRTYAELENLSNRELADIGVRRCDISNIARLHAYGN